MEPFYERNGITIYHGDSRDVLPHLSDIGLVVTSPPYFVGKEYELTCIKFSEYIAELLEIFTACHRALRTSRYCIINVDDAHVGQNHPEYNGQSAANLATHAHLIVGLDRLFTYKDLILWNKMRDFSGTTFINHPHYPISAFGEYILIFKKEGKTPESKEARLRDQLTPQEFKIFTKGVWDFPGQTSSRIHPAEFPIDLPLRVIKMFSFRHDTVLDPFGGGCTTAVAAGLMGRKCICIEREERYCEIAAKRLSQDTLGI